MHSLGVLDSAKSVMFVALNQIEPLEEAEAVDQAGEEVAVDPNTF